MAEVRLTDIPDTGTDLEHYVAALFQASGYYVEKNLIERAPADLLELDIVVSDYSKARPESTLVEAKGGKWGWSDLFKTLGWMQYLTMSRACLFVKTSDEKPIEQMVKKMEPHGLKVVWFQSFDPPFSDFSDAGYGAPQENLVPLWRHSYAIERKLTQVVADATKADNSEGPSAALDYLRLINDGTFFATDSIERLWMLYQAYQQHPKLTLASASEMEGATFDPHAGTEANTSLQSALYHGKHPLLQACMFIEHRARLALLKAAVDFTCEYPDGPPPARAGQINSLPATFHAGRAWLAAQPDFRRYPVFWQQFLWGYGGFYLQHREQEEFKWMAEYSGIRIDEIPVALQAFDRLFPIPGEWLTTAGPSDAKFARMVPTYFKGLGAHHRKDQYNIEGSWLAIQGAPYTAKDVISWNNSAVAFLTQ